MAQYRQAFQKTTYRVGFRFPLDLGFAIPSHSTLRVGVDSEASCSVLFSIVRGSFGVVAVQDSVDGDRINTIVIQSSQANWKTVRERTRRRERGGYRIRFSFKRTT